MNKCSMLIAFLLVGMAVQAQQKIGYFLPKKVLIVSVPFKIVQTKNILIKDNSTISVQTVVSLDGEVSVESKIYPNEYYELDLSPLGKAGRAYNFELGYDVNGNGVIASLNAKQEPITADIIKGTLGIVTSTLKILTGGIYGMDGAKSLKPTIRSEVTEQKVTVKKVIDLKVGDNNVSFDIKPDLTPLGANTLASPKLSVQASLDIKQIPSADPRTSMKVDNSFPFYMMYRVPATYHLKVALKDDMLLASRAIIDEELLIPQVGTLTHIQIPVLKGKKTMALAFNGSTGLLTKYSLVKESTTKAVFDNTSAGLDGLSAEIKSWKASSIKEKDADEKKRIEEEKERAEKAKDTSLADEIAKLKLENERLDLLIKQKELNSKVDKKN